MGKKKIKNLFLILVVMLILVGIPYLIYSLGSLIEINYFGYINNWWVVLLFIVVLISVFILAGIKFEKYMSHFFLLLFTISFFLLGIRWGVKPNLDLESYTRLLEKEREIERLDSIRLMLENDMEKLNVANVDELVSQSPDFKNHEIVFFSPGSAELSSFNKQRIIAFVSTLENCKLNINGYSDDSGTNSTNMSISDERAQNVAEFIKSINQQNNVINRVVGFGNDFNLVENTNESSRAKNRRVTIEIVGKSNADLKKIQAEIDHYNNQINDLMAERDSLRKMVFQGVEQ